MSALRSYGMDADSILPLLLSVFGKTCLDRVRVVHLRLERTTDAAPFPPNIGAGCRRGTAPRRRESRWPGRPTRLPPPAPAGVRLGGGPATAARAGRSAPSTPVRSREREDDRKFAEGGRRVLDVVRGAGKRIRPARTAADAHPAGDSRRGGRGPASATGTRPARPPSDFAFRGQWRVRNRDCPGDSGAPTLPGARVGAGPPRSAPGANLREPGNRREQLPGSGPAGAAAFRFGHPGPPAPGGSRGRRRGAPWKASPGSAVPAGGTKASGTCLGTSGFAGRERGGAADRRVGPCPRWASRPRKESPVVAPVFRGPSGTRCRRRGGRWSPAVPCSVAQVRVSRIGTKILLSRIPGAFLPRSAGGPPAGSGAVALPAGGWRAYALSGPRTG